VFDSSENEGCIIFGTEKVGSSLWLPPLRVNVPSLTNEPSFVKKRTSEFKAAKNKLL
jgi:hypothetical protein